MSRAETISHVLDGTKPLTQRLPGPGQADAVARWLSADGLGAVLFVRHRRDGMLAAELSLAVRDAAGKWRDLELDSGGNGYPDFFSGLLDPAAAVLLGSTETLVSESEFRDGAATIVRFLEVWVGGAITSVTCTADSTSVDQEISPLGVCLAGVVGEESAAVHVRAEEETLYVMPLTTSAIE
ncbi:hypothetical protein [Nonomuraea fuscirosea]|nr:hypothetical protein [Nonomuraea fuscirosea]